MKEGGGGTPWVLAKPLADDLYAMGSRLLSGKRLSQKDATALHAAAGILRAVERALMD